MPSERWIERQELAHERGFDTEYQQYQWIKHERETFGEIDFDTALTAAQFERDYQVGTMDRGDEDDGRTDTIAAWYEANIGEIDWDDPEDPFWEFLDALSGE